MRYLGIDIGGTKCAVILGNENGEILNKIRFDTLPQRGYKAVLDEICAGMEQLLSRKGLSAHDIASAGISCGGPLDSRAGVIKSPPNLPGWDNVPVCDIIRGKFGFPVYLQNDANACAIAEWKLGAGRGCENMIFLTFGTGMGAGLILGGRLYSGTNDMAGEVGHIRIAKDGPEGYGKKGSFEGFCSGGGIARLAPVVIEDFERRGIKTSIPLSDVSAKTVAIAAKAGDEAAIETYRLCGEKLGGALAILVDILNPQKIVIGSIFERSGELLSESMLKSLNEEALAISLAECEIVPAMLGDSIGDYAALSVAFNADIFKGGSHN